MRPIAIKTSAGYLDLNGSIRFKLLNPMFQHDSISAIAVFPFELPGTPNNKKKLQYFNLAEDVQNINSLEATIYLYGNVFLKGGLKYKWVKDHFEAQFSQIMKLYDNKDKLLNTIALGEYDFDNQSGFSLMYDYIRDRAEDSWAGAKDVVFFPMYNPSLFNNKEALKGSPSPYATPFDSLLPEQYAQYLNYWDYHEEDAGSPEFTDFWFRSAGTPDRVNDLVMSPAFYLKNLLTKLFAQNDFPILISPDFLDVGDIGKLVITTDKFFRMRLNFTAPGGTPAFTPLFIDFIDFIFKQSEFLPDVKIIDFLNGIKNFFNLSYFFGLTDGRVEIRHNETLLLDESYEEWTHKCFLLHEKEAEILDSITLKYSRADDAMYNKVKSLQGRTILDPVATFADLVAETERGLLCLVIDENIYYEQEYGLSGLEWVFYSLAIADYAAAGVLELETNSDTINTTIQQDQIESLLTDHLEPLAVTAYTGKKVWRVPELETAGNSDRFGLTPKGAGYVRFLFYRGMNLYVDHYNFWITGHTDPIYPYGTCDEYSPIRTVIGTHSLLLNGERGVYNKWWALWVEFIKNKIPVRRVVNLTLDDLLRLDFKKKKMIDGLKYFIKEGDVVISNEKGIEPAVIDFLKVFSNTNEEEEELDPHVVAFLEEYTAITDPDQIEALFYLVPALKAAGLWSKFYFIKVRCGDATSMGGNIVNISNHESTYHGGGWDYSSTNSQLPNGSTSYENHHFNPSVTFSPTNGCIGYYTASAVTAANQYDIGSSSGADANTFAMLVRYIGDLFIVAMGTNTGLLASNTVTKGLYVMNKNAADVESYKDGAFLGSGSDPGTPENLNIYEGASNRGGTAFYFSNKESCLTFACDTLTGPEIATVTTIFQTFLTMKGITL